MMKPSTKAAMVKMELRMGQRHFLGYGVETEEYNEMAAVCEYKRRLAKALQAVAIVADVVVTPFEQDCKTLFETAVNELKGV